jgi:CRP-like cAMP-binding protein
MADRWRYTIEQLADFVFLDVPGRLAKALVNRAGRMRPSGDSTNGAFLDLTQHDLASFVGATREMVNKTLHTFARQSWIELREGRVRVLREDLLRTVYE